MKKILFLLCLLPSLIYAQEYKVRSNMRVSGYMVLDPVPALPSPSLPIGLVNFNDTLRVNFGGAWWPWTPGINGNVVASSDTFPVIYIDEKMQFIDGGYIQNSGTSIITIHPGSDPNEYITIKQNQYTGTTISEVDDLQFNSLSGVFSDPMRGFRDDSTSSTNENAVTLSARAIRQISQKGSGISGDQPVTFQDSISLGYEGTANNENRIVKLTATGAMEATYLPQSLQYTLSNTPMSNADTTTHYDLVIGKNMSGMNLISAEVYCSVSAGTRTVTMNVLRDRGGSYVVMTSSGASFGTDATINPSYADVIRSDRLGFHVTLSGTGSDTPPDAILIILTFQKP
jgi:hypothetical protein